MEKFKIGRDERGFFVYENFDEGAVIYTGTHEQCELVVSALTTFPDATINELKMKFPELR